MANEYLRHRDRLREVRRDQSGRDSRVQGGSRATGARDYYGEEGRFRGSQRVSPGGEYLGPESQDYETEAYTDQGYGENRGHSDWRTEDRLDSTGGYGGRDYGRRAYGSGRGDAESLGMRREETRVGQHRGRGPRGYRRSDDRIREDVCELLTEDSRVDASNLEVSVENSEVALKGTVSSREEKRRAEDLAEEVSGVQDVHNTLRIAAGVPSGERAASPSARH